MSVIIKGFNKPKDCYNCRFNDSDCWCSITKGTIDRDDYTCTIPCPIEQLPKVESEDKEWSKIGHCKNCKWWKDSDGVYRRGVESESQCPINRREVLEGTGYCFMFESRVCEE